jgi:hypothetical protein
MVKVLNCNPLLQRELAARALHYVRAVPAL